MPPKLEPISSHIAKIVKEREWLAGRKPLTIASTCVYIVSQIYQGKANDKSKYNLKDISYESHTAETTIKTAYSIIYPYRFEFIPSSYAKKDEILKYLKEP